MKLTDCPMLSVTQASEPSWRNRNTCICKVPSYTQQQTEREESGCTMLLFLSPIFHTCPLSIWTQALWLYTSRDATFLGYPWPRTTLYRLISRLNWYLWPCVGLRRGLQPRILRIIMCQGSCQKCFNTLPCMCLACWRHLCFPQLCKCQQIANTTTWWLSWST